MVTMIYLAHVKACLPHDKILRLLLVSYLINVYFPKFSDSGHIPQNHLSRLYLKSNDRRHILSEKQTCERYLCIIKISSFNVIGSDKNCNY